MSLNRATAQGVWTSRWTFVSAAAGLAIGLGNFWRFADYAGSNGGLAYLILFLAFALLIATPVMIAEVALGSRGRASPMVTMIHLTTEAGASKGWLLVPVLAGAAALLILSWLSVVAGWTLAYVPIMAKERLTAASLELSGDIFRDLIESRGQMIYWHSLFVAAVVALACLNMTRALGQILRIVVPIILLLLVAAVYCGYRLGDMGAAVNYLFALRMEDFTWQAALAALRQAFFTLGIGLGAMMVYGAYFPDGRSVSRQVLAVVFLDTLVAILAGMSIYALVLDHNIEPGNGAALLFVSLPYAFGAILFGDIFGALFFAMLALVTLTSALALLEPAVAWTYERFRMPRIAGALLFGGLIWSLGLVWINSLTVWSEWQWQGRVALDWLNIIAGDILVPLAALGIALFAGWCIRPEVLRDELFRNVRQLFSLWRVLVRYIAPPALLALLAGGLYQRFWV